MHLCGIDFQSCQAQKHKRQTDDKLTQVGVPLCVNEDNSQENCGIDHKSHVEGSAAQHHNPRRERGTDIGTHDDRDGLLKSQQSCTHERDSHDRRSCR